MRRSAKLALPALGAALLALASGCDNREPENPTLPTSELPTSAPSSAPIDANLQAPRVQQPLDATAVVADPCKSLTETQVREFALSAGKKDPESVTAGETCAWDNNDAQIEVDVTYQPELNGLSHLYAQHASGQYDVWEPTDVDGYPAVHVGESVIDKMGDCNIAVGLTDSLFFRASITGNEGDDSCTAARNVASAVLETIKAGGG